MTVQYIHVAKVLVLMVLTTLLVTVLDPATLVQHVLRILMNVKLTTPVILMLLALITLVHISVTVNQDLLERTVMRILMTVAVTLASMEVCQSNHDQIN